MLTYVIYMASKNMSRYNTWSFQDLTIKEAPAGPDARADAQHFFPSLAMAKLVLWLSMTWIFLGQRLDKKDRVENFKYTEFEK